MKFLFDLDGTLTKVETLPIIAEKFNIAKDIEALTKKTISGDIPFQESFIKRVNFLKNLPVDEISKALENIELCEGLINFIHENIEDCIVVTGNLDSWIGSLAKRIGCEIRSSNALVQDNKIQKINKIQKKEDVVQELQAKGEMVVYIGDGNNDAEAMRLADVSIACGIVHAPARSVMDVADYLVYEEVAMVRLLNQIRRPQIGKSVVITAAGIGSRLGMGKTKVLIDVNGEPLINYLLANFREFKDIRIVIGYEYAEVIKAVLVKKRDVIFAFNHDYFHTKSCASLYLGARHGFDQILGWDGDLLVYPEDLNRCLNIDGEFLGCSTIKTEDGVFVKIDDGKVIEFSVKDDSSGLEWSGPFQIEKNKILNEPGNIYEMLSRYLPLPMLQIKAFDIDTFADYERALQLQGAWSFHNASTSAYYERMAERITNPLETRNKAPDFSSYDVNFVRKFSNPSSKLLDLGSGSGLLINNLINCFAEITAVEKYEKFSNFICQAENIQVVNKDVLDFIPNQQYEIVTAFGLMNFFSYEEAKTVYKRVYSCLVEGGIFIVKHQMGLAQDILVNGYSSELNCDYFSLYRHVESEAGILEEIGFTVEEQVDIYPPEFNRWDNTHFFALVCRK